MPDILTLLTEQAVAVFREKALVRQENQNIFGSFFNSDHVLQGAQLASSLPPTRHTELVNLANQIFLEPEFSIVAPQDGELDPMIMYPSGGSRSPASGLVSAIFTSAFLQMYYLRLPNTESVFVRTVLEGYEELRRAIRGERVRTYTITGIARFSLSVGAQVSTPWGVIRPAPSENVGIGFHPFQPITTCILVEPKLVPVVFDRSPSPVQSFDTADLEPSRSNYLFPLACALASKEASNPVVPLITWVTSLLPFQQNFGYSFPMLPPSFGANSDFGDRSAELEEWARIVDRAHAQGIEIAAKRLVSAVAHRMDRSDALIDAVMVWENLLGTSNEVTFRVSAALAKLTERDPAKRRVLRKKLSEIYGIRSRLIHGAPVDPTTINNSYSEAIGVAVQALRASYNKGREWLSLSSNERSDEILLEWQ